MKFLILFLIPLSAFSREIKCEGIGFHYNRARVKIGAERVLIEMNSYFMEGRLSQAKLIYPKPIVRVSFDRDDCKVSSSRSIIQCQVNQSKTITFINRITGGITDERDLEVDSLSFSLSLQKELVLLEEDQLAQVRSHLSVLSYRKNNKTEYLQIYFPTLRDKLACH